MEIEFNTNRVSKPEPVQPVPRQDAARRVEDDAFFENTQALEIQLKELRDIRPDKVEQARALIANVQYPPEQVLQSLATLLALKFK